MNEHITEILRQAANIISIGTITEINGSKCRVAIGDIEADYLETDYIDIATTRAGNVKIWLAPTVGEQVLLVAINGELTTAFQIGAVFSQANPAPSTESNTAYLQFSDGATFSYNGNTGALTISGVKNADINITENTTVTCPQTTFNGNVTIKSLSVTNGGTLKGDFDHSGGKLTSNGIVADQHTHSGVQSGGSNTGKPQ